MPKKIKIASVKVHMPNYMKPENFCKDEDLVWDLFKHFYGFYTDEAFAKSLISVINKAQKDKVGANSMD